MSSLPSFISRLTTASLRHPGRFLAVAAALTVLSGALAARLEIRSSFEELLPPKLPSVRHAKELAKRVGGDGTVLVNVEVLEGGDLRHAQAMAERLGQEYRDLGPEVVRSVQTSVLRIEGWYADHWPLFAEPADLEMARDELVRALGLAKAKLNPVMNLLDEEEEPAGPPLEVNHPLLDPSRLDPREQVEQRFARYRDGYMVHPDGRSVTVVVRPTGTSLGVGEARVLLDRMRSVAERHRAELDREHLRVGFAGTFPILLSEYEAIVGNVFETFALVMVLVLASIWLFFREFRPVLALGTVITVAVAVTFGLTWLGIGYLNTQTAFLGSIVAGNGINYGLIYLARVGQLRRQGVALEPALHEGADAAARSTLLAALGTSVCFGTLLLASNRGFRDFGFIGGIGMILCWGSTFALLPAVLVVFERIRPDRQQARPPANDRALALLERFFSRPRAILATFAVITAVSTALFLWRLPDAMERNLDNLGNEVKGNPELKRDNDRANAALGQSITGVVALLPSPQAAEQYCAQVRQRMQATPRLRELIDGCETITSVVPTRQEEKLAIIADIRERLTDRVLSRLPTAQADRARALREQLAAQRPVTSADAPPVLVDRFRERDGSIGRLAFVRAKPQAKLELDPNLRDFVAGVRNVPVEGQRFDAAGETVVIADLLADIEREGPRTTLFAFVGICLLVMVFFRSASHSAQILTTLTVGVLIMAGVAAAIDLKVNFFNFVVYPITFGIAVDYGANVLARQRARGNVLPSLVEVGPAVILCSWTTIVGYGSLLFSINRALRSFGWYAMLGEFTSILTALMLIPAIALARPALQTQEVKHAP